jgi:sterol desaturase/sphingolipid hydroxylase (fatty acid hydroxylase superfamily)
MDFSALKNFALHFDAPEERIYWPYLLSSLVIGILVYGVRGHIGNLKRDLFSKDIWFHPSARLDYRLFAFRFALSLLLTVPAWFSASYLAIKISLQLFSVGEPPEISFSKTTWTALYTVTLFLFSDFSRFILHRWMHTVNLLWRFHQVHHSAEVMTPITLYRTHPIEGLLVTLRGIIVMGVIGGLFAWLTRGQVRALEIAGINAFAFVFNFLGSNLRHSHVFISFGPLERFLISPGQHQLHHERSTSGLNVNYGSFLALWDRMFGSHVRAIVPPESFGVGGELNHHPHKLVSVLLGVFSFKRKSP